MNSSDLQHNWKMNSAILTEQGIRQSALGKMVKLDRGGYGKIAGLNPRSIRPFKITFKINGQNRVISADLTAFKRLAKAWL